MSTIPINLIRYLFVLRVNRSMAWLSNYLPTEISLVLGTAIAKRLPTAQARPWLKSLAAWGPYSGSKSMADKLIKRIPELSWPIESVIFAYPYEKRSFGEGEFILWELKLFGDSADHGYFLETIMPAVEEAGLSYDKRMTYPNCLWGKFEINAVYAARGNLWEPIVENGQLNLNYQATPFQWSENLSYTVNPELPPDTIRWLAPYDLSDKAEKHHSRKTWRINSQHQNRAMPAPSLKKIIEALIFRLNNLVAGKITNFDELWEFIGIEQQTALKTAWKQASHIPIYKKALCAPPAHWPGVAMGCQTYTATFPEALIPLLGLAAILHIGRYTHYGLGTFTIERQSGLSS